MTLRVGVKPELFRWARERAGIAPEALVKRFPKYQEWESGEKQPTFKQLERLAKATHAPVGTFFLSQPLREPVPIPDLRTVGNRLAGQPSVDLLDTVYLCQQRQDWYRDYARMEGEAPLPFVGSATLASDVEPTASRMRAALGFDLDGRRALRTWTDALRRFIEQVDSLGVLVMLNGVVGNNTRRKLDPKEFRGFALADDLAPLIFINGADTKAAQMFTLAHGLAHIWIGESALSDVEPVSAPSHEIELWCNRVAAELLVPQATLQGAYRQGVDLPTQLNRLACHFKVSTLVVLRRIFDIGAIDRGEFDLAYGQELDRILSMTTAGGGDFHPIRKTRVGQRFGRALVASTLGGRTSFSESFRLLGIRKTSTLREFAASLEVGSYR